MDDETRTSFCHTADFPSPSSCFINTLEFQITNQSLVGLGVAAGESLQNGRERIRREDSEGCHLDILRITSDDVMSSVSVNELLSVNVPSR